MFSVSMALICYQSLVRSTSEGLRRHEEEKSKHPFPNKVGIGQEEAHKARLECRYSFIHKGQKAQADQRMKEKWENDIGRYMYKIFIIKSLKVTKFSHLVYLHYRTMNRM